VTTIHNILVGHYLSLDLGQNSSHPHFFSKMGKKYMNGNLTYQINVSLSVHNAVKLYFTMILQNTVHLNITDITKKNNVSADIRQVHTVDNTNFTPKQAMTVLITCLCKPSAKSHFQN